MSVMIVRAIVSAITYDEAYTYMRYALPLCDKFSVSFITSLYNNCLLNNHWLNTFLIALVARISRVRYNEFMGLARGYGMCTCIVFLALIMFKRYILGFA